MMMDQHGRNRIAPGDALASLSFGPITRADLTRYAAASGDFNPIHIDRDFAQASGHDDVFAHGMLSLGLAGRLVAEWVGPERVRHISGRFTALTHVNDLITVYGTVIAVSEGQEGREARVELRVETGGRTTVVGEAVVVLDIQRFG